VIYKELVNSIEGWATDEGLARRLFDEPLGLKMIPTPSMTHDNYKDGRDITDVGEGGRWKR
jgi:hypothetical protein